jgi:hypothetical protein
MSGDVYRSVTIHGLLRADCLFFVCRLPKSAHYSRRRGFSKQKQRGAVMITDEAFAAPLVEPAIAPEVHVDGVAYVDRLGETIKITYFTLQRSILTGHMERVVCLRLTCSLSAVQRMEAEWQPTLPGRSEPRDMIVVAHH